MRCAKPYIRKTQSGENAQVVTPVWIVAQSQCSWQVSARAVVRSGVGVVSGVDRSPALRLPWVLSALGPVSSSWLVSLDTCTSDSAPSVLLSVTGLDSSATPKPRPPARCQKTCPPPAQLTSAQLSCLRLSLAHLSSAHLRLGPSAGRPHSVSPLALNLQPNPSRCLQLVWSARACGPRAARPAAGRMGRAERCSQPVRLSPLAPRSGPKLNSSTCEPPVIDL